MSNLELQVLYHIAYEDAVWANNPAPSAGYDGFTRVADPAAATRSAAGISRSYYSTVVKFASEGYSPAVDAATGTVLEKAVNGLADLIKSISVAAGR
ncbi:MAG: hypothetical protein LLG45_00040 [Actinomycetia bacterium]|nr:hypothetical protein [Actinomycetes bacterium]